MTKKIPSKKKGPKGKKARAAAKLQRQWGEEVDEKDAEKAKIRKGKSRLHGTPSRVKSRSLKKVQFRGNDSLNDISDPNRNDESSLNSVDSMDDENMVGQDERSLANLLKVIQKEHISKSRMSQKNMDDVSIDTDSDDSEHIHKQDDVMESDAKEENVPDDDFLRNLLDEMKPIGKNIYHERFGMEPLVENITASENSKVMKKITPLGLHDDFMIQLSVNAKERLASIPSTDILTHVDRTLIQNWVRMNKDAWKKNSGHSGMSDRNPLLSDLQNALYPAIGTYCDGLITCASRENNDAIQNLMLLHILNHTLTANGHITSHNNIIREMQKRGEDLDLEYRDQGYTRGKVLVLLPTKSLAHQFITHMLEFLGDTATIQNGERFETEYGPDLELNINDDAQQKLRNFQKSKGPDWYELFSDEVKSEDDFKLGISLSNAKEKKKKKKDDINNVNVKLYSEFYHSDIIVASPLGLKLSITSEGEESVDADFLSSIEICYIDHSDVLLMQNFDHVLSVLSRLNGQPTKSAGIDFSRVRNYLLSGQAAMWRQLVMVSRFSDPHIISAFNRFSKSIAGALKIRKRVSADDASICDVMTNVRQVFQRINCDSILTQGEARVKYFEDVILPQLMQSKQKSTLIFIPSYFDFLAVRNVMLKHEVLCNHFVSVTEYARNTEVSRGRHRFLQGKKRIMLYTGRAYFFLRHRIKGAKHLIMFSLPEYPEFYPELLNMLSDDHQDTTEEEMDMPLSCLNLFSKYDAQCLERVVGTKHAERMTKGEKRTFLFNS